MDWNKFSSKFHSSWHKKIKPFIESAECDAIYEFLKKESKNGKQIAPESINTFRAFYETPLNEIQVIIIGNSPYNTFTKEGCVADGLLLGCSITKDVHVILNQFYDGLERDVYNGINLNYMKIPDVSYLSHQGALMLNAALTIEKDKINNHLKLWEPFIKYLFENVFNIIGVPIIFLGKDAAKLKKYANSHIHTFEIEHPENHLYDWNSNGVFSRVNDIIWETNEDVIQWLYNEEPPF